MLLAVFIFFATSAPVAIVPKDLDPSVLPLEVRLRRYLIRNDGPKRLRKPTEPAEMKLSDPIEKLAGHKGVEDSWKAKADPRDSPYQNKKRTPKADCAVQVPIETRELCFPVDGSTAPPVLDSRPPRSDACRLAFPVPFPRTA